MTLEKMIKSAIKIEPKNGWVLLRGKAYGRTWYFEKAWLGLNDKDPIENAKKVMPHCTEFEFYDIPEKMKSGFSFGVGRPQSKRDL